MQFDSKAVVLKNADELAEKGTVKSAELVKVADLHENETVLVKNAERCLLYTSDAADEEFAV